MALDLRKYDIEELSNNSRNAGYRRLAKLKPGRRYVLLDPKSFKEDEDDQRGRRAAETVKELADVLNGMASADSRLLQCDGWYEDQAQEQFYLVFRLPPESDESPKEPLILYHLYGNFLPRLHMRFQLAHALASAVLEVHRRKWLHKGIRSENVIFFQSNKHPKRNIENMKLIGFDYARKDMPDAHSEKPMSTHANLYRHPLALRNPTVRFNRLHDYYALGVVLVEIAWWSPMEVILKKHQNLQAVECRETDVEKVQDILLDRDLNSTEKYQTVLAFKMGEIYRDAVRVCLTGDFGVGVDDPALLDSFEERVLKPLQRIVV